LNVFSAGINGVSCV